MTSPFFNTRDAAQYLRCSRSYLEKLRLTGGGPNFRKHGKSVRYSADDLDAWSRSRSFGSTTETAAAAA